MQHISRDFFTNCVVLLLVIFFKSFCSYKYYCTNIPNLTDIFAGCDVQLHLTKTAFIHHIPIYGPSKRQTNEQRHQTMLTGSIFEKNKIFPSSYFFLSAFTFFSHIWDLFLKNDGCSVLEFSWNFRFYSTYVSCIVIFAH